MLPISSLTLTAESSIDNLEIIVFNRYGDRIHTLSSNGYWTGDGSPPGVYYWLANYITCEGEQKTLKGYVYLYR